MKGVAAVLANAITYRSTFTLFSLIERVAIVTGGHRGIGLEIAFALAEAGAVVYCLDLPEQPDQDWLKVLKFATTLPDFAGPGPTDASLKGRLEYASCDVTKQQDTWALVEKIAEKEGRLDVCVACAGILRSAEALDYPAQDFQKLLEINVCGVLYTAQAAGRQMVKFNIPGSIIMVGSMSGSITNKGMHWTAYNTSKAAVIQMARSMACELGPKNIRVNSISPGYVFTEMTKAFLDDKPELKQSWSSDNPLGRLARPDEMRGVALFLASDASTFCTGSDLIVDGGHRAW
jgi:NAD(P)-dependent dehydrogenase (short-subunit alcohol dehydrogenase family)